MKTPQEILKHQLGGMSIKYAPVLEPHIQMAMKEYAKQWIERAAKVGREYPYGEAITESIMDIKDEIDAQ